MGVSGIHAGHDHGGVRRAVVDGAGAGTASGTGAGVGEATGGGERAAKGQGGEQAADGADAVQQGAGAGETKRGRGRRGKGRGRGRGRGNGGGGGCNKGGGGAGGAENGAAKLARPGATTQGVAPTGAATTGTDAGAGTGEQAAAATLAAVTAATGSAATTPSAASELISQVAADFEGSPVAQQVLQLLAAGEGAIDVLDDAQFAAKYGRASGVYDTQTNRISIPQSLLQDRETLRIVLLHEGVHWVQDNAPGGIAQVGGPIAQALQGAGALRAVDPTTPEGSQHDEAQAFLLEAIAAAEAGVRDPGLATTGSGILGYDQVLAAVRSIPEYA
jgi:hypothetical protein